MDIGYFLAGFMEMNSNIPQVASLLSKVSQVIDDSKEACSGHTLSVSLCALSRMNLKDPISQNALRAVLAYAERTPNVQFNANQLIRAFQGIRLLKCESEEVTFYLI